MPSSVEGKCYNKAIHIYVKVIRIVNENISKNNNKEKSVIM